MSPPEAAVDLAPLLQVAAISIAAGVGGIVCFAIGVRIYARSVERRDQR